MTLRDALLRGRRRPRRFGAGSPTTYRGDGYEFVELREYVAGDDVRRIDWAATARAGSLQTRVVLEDVALTLAAFVDESPSMNVGRRRPLRAAAAEAQRAWFDAARPGDRCTTVPSDGPFALERVLSIADALLARGSALLAIGDWFELDAAKEASLARLAARCDCTALVARDPWYAGLPLSGFVRVRGAEGGSARYYVGRRERNAYVRAVREREEHVCATLERVGWRVGVFTEDDGVRGLLDAFGLHALERS